ncbi:maleylpyruvate isomerase family mycothiol-dependent enzyme [Nocardia asteroides]|uniref:maleylpyruvate isomerase family mycothiol-dependent enzyme n=1 Tax=Nocardia asteroides TaxID=1824 RepID=UPI001E3A3CF5|nr:maleylpyruvate isomerase family mycothiol-dependent enzyme [Nocardia asteroides]UGT61495.1 maleylpyruvate isomerase family mycothiol-dependent enzyme [Nocardia asteroides]
MSDTEVRAAIAAERTELAELLAGLDAAAWEAPTLCAGWRPREVLAHMTMAYRLSLPRFALDMVKARGNFNRMSDRRARADAAALTPEELVASLRDNAGHPWKPPGSGYEATLAHEVIHGMDITVALGLPRRVPIERVAVVLADTKPQQVSYFGTDLSGVELRADDLDWSLTGDAPESVVSGTAQDLLLVLCGRKLPAGRLAGEQASRYEAG